MFYALLLQNPRNYLPSIHGTIRPSESFLGQSEKHGCVLAHVRIMCDMVKRNSLPDKPCKSFYESACPTFRQCVGRSYEKRFYPSKEFVNQAPIPVLLSTGCQRGFPARVCGDPPEARFRR